MGRFYRGLVPALAQGPLSRFGDTAANTGVLALMESSPHTKDLPIMVKTLFASGMAASWRIFLTPIDTVKTIMQVEGKDGLAKLAMKRKAGGNIVIYHGALASAAATFAGHYPWFATYNVLNSHIPRYEDVLLKKLGRDAFIGFISSIVSDSVSNSLRVIKTYRQTHEVVIPYSRAIREVLEKDGYQGLFGRGLRTRILANGMQGLMFSVMWRYFDDLIKNAK